MPPTRLGDPDGGWYLIEEGFEPEREHEIESLFTVGNGYLGTRGSLQEGFSLSRPATFVAGVYGTVPGEVPALVLAPDWAKIKVNVAGMPVRLDVGKTLEHLRGLDMRRGLYLREWTHQDEAGRITRLRYTRLASLADRRALYEAVAITPENYCEKVSVECLIDTAVVDSYGRRHVEVVDMTAGLSRSRTTNASDEASSPFSVTVRAPGGGAMVAFAADSAWHSDHPTEVTCRPLTANGWAGEAWEWEAEMGRTYHVEKVVTIATSRDAPVPESAAREHLARLLATGTRRLVSEHEAAWARRWSESGVDIPGSEQDQRALRFAVYHLIKSANPDDEYVSIGARALTGESYKGHVFWDTDIYLLPFYIHTHPPSARSLSMFRYHTLPAARAKARSMGYPGALYPWESTADGEEATPPFAIAPTGEVIPILTGELEQHISADVAYGCWQYWQFTGDDGFFVDAGAEIVLETSRFWAGRVSAEDDGLYHIRRVIGPDEYHEAVDDNAFTNVMAQWNLERGAETARLLRQSWPSHWARLRDQLGLHEDEPDAWLEIAQRMYTGFDPATGLFEQFQGYFDLEYVDLAAYEPRTAPMDVILGREHTARTQVIKQPDVVMLIYLLWDRFPEEVRRANFEYYEPRCGHGSSLSPSIHALVAARLGQEETARRYFRQSAEIDLSNNMGNAAGGVHSGAQGGLWQAAVFGFGGARPARDAVFLDPRPLPEWGSLRFPFRWRGTLMRVEADAAGSAEVAVARGGPARLRLPGDGGAPFEVTLAGKWRGRRRGKAGDTSQENSGWSTEKIR